MSTPPGRLDQETNCTGKVKLFLWRMAIKTESCKSDWAVLPSPSYIQSISEASSWVTSECYHVPLDFKKMLQSLLTRVPAYLQGYLPQVKTFLCMCGHTSGYPSHFRKWTELTRPPASHWLRQNSPDIFRAKSNLFLDKSFLEIRDIMQHIPHIQPWPSQVCYENRIIWYYLFIAHT